eukprot:310402-Hanusia_phi.AAC.1
MLAISKKTLGRLQTTATMTVPENKAIPEMPPLHTACHRGSMAEVRKWVEMGEDVNEQTKSGLTPLMCACKTIGPKPEDDQIVAFLLEHRANVDLADQVPRGRGRWRTLGGVEHTVDGRHCAACCRVYSGPEHSSASCWVPQVKKQELTTSSTSSVPGARLLVLTCSLLLRDSTGYSRL